MHRFSVLALTLAALAAPAAATAAPIPQTRSFPAFEGTAATPQPLTAPDPPRHPFMAPNGASNLHADAYQTDTYQGYGPLGRGGVVTTSAAYTADCASVTFDSRGRIVTACVGLNAVTLRLLDPRTLATLASLQLPARNPLSGGNPFQNFSGGGYFYLDHEDRAVLTTAQRHLLTIAVTDGPAFKVVSDIDLSGVVPDGDGVVSTLPDWTGRIWFVSKAGIVGTVDRATGAVKAIDTKEGIGNSFAVDRDGSVSIVTNRALYRFEAAADGTPTVVWREQYENTGTQKSGQSQAGSGTTPTLIGDDLVAITDNADPIHVNVYRRGRSVSGPRLTCSLPVFGKGASSTDQSLIATPDLIVVENNFGYDSPLSVELGRTTTPGLVGIRLRKDGTCEQQWRSDEIAPTVVPKISLAAGLVYTYTKPRRTDLGDPWYLTTIDARTGRTVYKALAGEGLGYNNNYAPVTLGPDGAAYVGVLGGIVRLADRDPLPSLPAATPASRAKVVLRVRCSGGRAIATIGGSKRIQRVVVRVAGGQPARRDAKRPFRVRLRGRAGAVVRATVTVRGEAKPRQLRGRVPRC